mgnify:CR=1 FL=1
MLKYNEIENKIEIIGKEEFNPKHILECGQFFRYKKIDEKTYELVSGNHLITIIENDNGYTLLTNDCTFAKDLFNFNVDYAVIKNKIENIDGVKDKVHFANGLRILHNGEFETICSFIISQNNNIKRIKLIIERLCERAGAKIDETHYAFPLVEEMQKLDEQFFVSIGAGYRAKYLANLVDNYKSFLKCNPSSLSTDDLRRELLKILGVGRKVADCILLFAYNRTDVFPVDVWMERVYKEVFCGKETERTKMSEDLVERFGELSGYIQQYMFYYKTVEEKESR